MSSSELDHVDLIIYSSPYGFRDFRTPRLILVSLSSFLTELKDATLKGKKMEKKIVMDCLRFKHHLVFPAWNVDFFLALERYFGGLLSIQEQEKQTISANNLTKMLCIFLLSLFAYRLKTLRKMIQK